MDGIAVMQKAQNTALRQWLAGLMQKGVSQRELARRLNVSASKLNRFVCGVQDKFYVGAHDLETAAVMFSSPLPRGRGVRQPDAQRREGDHVSHRRG